MVTQLEKAQRHLNREYGNELIIDILGNVQHDNCVEHCLKLAFGDCNENHINCENCNQIDLIFQKILQIIPNEKNQINEYREKLQYFWAHQARKTYLNTQSKAALLRLDKDGAVIIVDYKMKILPQSAREVKSDFFGKKGLTLHTLLEHSGLYL